MKHLQLFENFNESSRLDQAYGHTFYKAKTDGTLTSGGFVPHPFTKGDGKIDFKEGETLMVYLQRGSMGDLYQLHKVEIEGNTIDYLSGQVSIWDDNLTTKQWFKDSFEEYNPRKK